VFICHPEPQLKRCDSEPQLKEYHVLNPYPEPQLKGYVPSHNSRNTSNPTFEASPKSLVDHAYRVNNTNIAVVKSSSRGHVLLGAARFQTAWKV